MDESVLIADYDPRWPAQAEEEMARVRAVCGGALLALEHVGSTAVPGMAAKPVIDLLGGVESLVVAEQLVAPLARLGYVYKSNLEDEIPDRRYFHKSVGGRRSHHLHLCVPGGDFWNDHILFRNYLRRNPAAAAEYERIKRELANHFTFDRYAYTEAKSPFILTCLERARAELNIENS